MRGADRRRPLDFEDSLESALVRTRWSMELRWPCERLGADCLAKPLDLRAGDLGRRRLPRPAPASSSPRRQSPPTITGIMSARILPGSSARAAPAIQAWSPWRRAGSLIALRRSVRVSVVDLHSTSPSNVHDGPLDRRGGVAATGWSRRSPGQLAGPGASRLGGQAGH